VGTVGSALSYSRFVKPQPSAHQQDPLALPRRLSRPKSVVVVGAGLAGLAAAYELSQRGFAVTLLERSPQIGGKIASWPIQVGDRTFLMEHGFHGFFPQYYNLKSILEELAISDNLKSLDYYSLVFRDNTYNSEVFRPSHSAFPWNIFDLAIASSNRLRWGIDLTKPAHWQVFRAITSFAIPRSYDRFDHLSVADWVAGDFPQGLYDLYFLPFAKSSLNAPDLLSTVELLQFFHFYFFGNPEGLAFNGTKDDMGTSIVQPIADRIVLNGGKIIAQATVSQIKVQDNQITALVYHCGNDQTETPFWVDLNPYLTSAGARYYGAGDRVFIESQAQNTDIVIPNAKTSAKPKTKPNAQAKAKVLALTCTHQGCTVAQQANGTFLCPCHGAQYNEEGKVIRGPARKDLAQFNVNQRKGEAAQLIAMNPQGKASEQTLEADYYILATDVPGTQYLFDRIEGEYPESLKQQIAQLAVADPFAVARFWFDRDFTWPHSNFASLSGYALTDSITLYHRIQGQFMEWTQETGGSVVELHAYCYKEAEFPTQDLLLSTFESELYEIVPELASAQLLHRELVNQKNFSGFPPHSYAQRPNTQSAIANLSFAGDWVKMPFPCGLMERAVSSGLLAGNNILQQEALQRRTLFSVQPEGILKI
jgi:isorenieratene synthase